MSERAAKETRKLKAAGWKRRGDARQRDLAWQWLRHHTQKMQNRDRTKAMLDAHDRQEIARYERILGIDHKGDDAA